MKISGKKLAKGLNLGAVFGYAASAFLIADKGILPGAIAMGAATALASAAGAVRKKKSRKKRYKDPMACRITGVCTLQEPEEDGPARKTLLQ